MATSWSVRAARQESADEADHKLYADDRIFDGLSSSRERSCL
jgi:hypothetical protein